MSAQAEFDFSREAHNNLLTMFPMPSGQIVFLQEPKNVTVSEGAEAFFACTYHGTTGVPVWRITNNVFVTSALPPRHSYNGTGLVVRNVDLSLNMNSYSCFFNVHIGGGRFVDIESTTGFLVIAGLHASIMQSV